MNDYNHIDELIRKKFEGFEPVPPESVWEKVKARIGTGGQGSKGGPLSLPIIVGIIVLVGLTTLLLLFTRIETTMPVHAGTNDQMLDHKDLSQQFVSRYLASNESVSTNTDEIGNTPEESSNLPNTIPVREPFDGKQALNEKTTLNFQQDEPVRVNKKTWEKRMKEFERFDDAAWKLKGKSYNGELDYSLATVPGLESRTGWKGMNQEDYVSSFKPNWSIGFHFTPEVSFYPSDNISNGLNYSLQVLPEVKFGNWFLSGGIGIRTGSDKGNYLINYNKFLGTYQDVIYVTFDTTENGLIPIYHTQTASAYDTVPYYSITESKARYTYLDVPLLIGHEWTFNHLSLFFQAGPSVSIYLGRTTPAAIYPEENIRILSKEQQIPARDQINWQIMAGAGFRYHFSDRVSLNLEPTLRYYLNNDFEKNQLNTRHPYSLGIRAGLIYHFNH